MILGKIILILVTLPPCYLWKVGDIAASLEKLLMFMGEYYEEINFDGLLGVTIAEVRRFLLEPANWKTITAFKQGSLRNLGVYKNWTENDLTNQKRAIYKNVPSDHCLLEIFENNCHVSPFCQEMMLSNRTDRGYLLSHRLFYLQIIRLRGCPFRTQRFEKYTNNLCSLMLKEARTNEKLNFPARDIFLEQVVLCGMEGYTEFLEPFWTKMILSWQNNFGCYESEHISKTRRSSNVIAFGCSDHTTGLASAALAITLRYRQRKLYNTNYKNAL